MKKTKTGDEVAELKRCCAKPGCEARRPAWPCCDNLRATPRAAQPCRLGEGTGAEGLDRATVYRNLMDLAEAGLVARAELGDHVWRYELRRKGHDHDIEHPHFVCVDCGQVTCLTDVKLEITPTPGSKKSSIGQLTEVLLKGHCGKCV